MVGEQSLREAVEQAAAAHALDARALMAVVLVESGGQMTARVGGRDEPLIRFEGHWFHRLLAPDRRARAVVAGLAHPTAGRIGNPRSQTARWRLIEKAAALDRPAALSATSWGVGQVMGLHWRWLGFGDVEALVAEARSGLAGQVRLMARFIAKSELGNALERRDWAGFARVYNGPAHARNRYGERMAAAFAKAGGAPAARPAGPALLRIGSTGPAVVQLQRDLTRLGIPLAADGDFGPATDAGLRALQRRLGLAEDGIFGPATAAALARAQPAVTEARAGCPFTPAVAGVSAGAMNKQQISRQDRIEAVMRAAPVIPVVVVNDPRAAVGMARALVEGGLPAIEVTLRTSRALDCLAAIAEEVEGAMPGAGTVLDASQVRAVEKAGGRFLVSPGASPRLLEAAEDSSLPLLPGAATAGEAMTLLERGYSALKFFPAEAAGGTALLKALAAPLPQIRFCPTGGIGPDNAATYLALPNVLCVGGSWVAPADAIAAGDWARITALAKAAAALSRSGQG